MAKLAISSSQKTAVIDPVNVDLENAFADGVEISGGTPVLEPMKFYKDRMQPPDKAITKDTFRQVIAALIKALNLQKPLPTPLSGSVTVVLAKVTPGGSNGSLTFIDGILTAKVDPT